MKSTLIACCIAAGALAGCSSLPSAGPMTGQVLQQATEQPRHFDLVEIDQRVVAALSAQPSTGLLDRFEAYGKPPSGTIGRGDKVAVSIWRMRMTAADPAGEMAEPVVLPVQTVGADGGISVPYAGRIPAAGYTPVQVQTEIDRRLAERVVQPRAVVTVTQSVSNSVTVVGEHVTGARVPLSLDGDRLLDIIAATGGAKSPIYQTSVRLSRDGQGITIPMSTLIANPKADIYAWPGDVISVVDIPKKFMSFGATFDNKLVPFGAARLNLAEAIVKAGGLLDLRADPKGVFVFRFEPPAVVKALGVPDLASRPGGDTPVVYRLNLNQVDGYFLAQRFAIADGDIVYVADARLTELQKFFSLIGTITAPVTGGLVVYRSVGH